MQVAAKCTNGSPRCNASCFGCATLRDAPVKKCVAHSRVSKIREPEFEAGVRQPKCPDRAKSTLRRIYEARCGTENSLRALARPMQTLEHGESNLEWQPGFRASADPCLVARGGRNGRAVADAAR